MLNLFMNTDIAYLCFDATKVKACVQVVIVLANMAIMFTMSNNRLLRCIVVI